MGIVDKQEMISRQFLLSSAVVSLLSDKLTARLLYFCSDSTCVRLLAERAGRRSVVKEVPMTGDKCFAFVVIPNS